MSKPIAMKQIGQLNTLNMSDDDDDPLLEKSAIQQQGNKKQNDFPQDIKQEFIQVYQAKICNETKWNKFYEKEHKDEINSMEEIINDLVVDKWKITIGDKVYKQQDNFFDCDILVQLQKEVINAKKQAGVNINEIKPQKFSSDSKWKNDQLQFGIFVTKDVLFNGLFYPKHNSNEEIITDSIAYSGQINKSGIPDGRGVQYHLRQKDGDIKCDAMYLGLQDKGIRTGRGVLLWKENMMSNDMFNDQNPTYSYIKGEFQYSRPHGPVQEKKLLKNNQGEIVNVQFFKGKYKHGLRDGDGLLIDGTTVFRGDFKKGMKHKGTEIKYFFDHKMFINATFPDVIMIESEMQKELEYKGTYHNDKYETNLHEKSTLKLFTIGQQYTGEFQQGNIHGKGVYRWVTEKCVYDGDFVNNKKEGEGSLTFSEGHSYKGYFKNDQLDGIGKYYNQATKLGQAEFKNGVQINIKEGSKNSIKDANVSNNQEKGEKMRMIG